MRWHLHDTLTVNSACAYRRHLFGPCGRSRTRSGNKQAKESFPEYLQLLSIPNDSVSPEDIRKNVDWLETAFRKRGFAVKQLANEGKPMLYAELSDSDARRIPAIEIQFEVNGTTRGDYDASRMREALNNLVSNAARFSDDAKIRVQLQRTASGLRLSVENAGASIPGDELTSLFEPLRRGRDASIDNVPNRTNLGLGLFIAQEVAKAHGGTIAVSSAGGVTTFLMTLPTAHV